MPAQVSLTPACIVVGSAPTQRRNGQRRPFAMKALARQTFSPITAQLETSPASPSRGRGPDRSAHKWSDPLLFEYVAFWDVSIVARDSPSVAGLGSRNRTRWSVARVHESGRDDGVTRTAAPDSRVRTVDPQHLPSTIRLLAQTAAKRNECPHTIDVMSCEFASAKSHLTGSERRKLS